MALFVLGLFLVGLRIGWHAVGVLGNTFLPAWVLTVLVGACVVLVWWLRIV